MDDDKPGRQCAGYATHAFTPRWQTEDGRLRCYYCGAIKPKEA